MNNKKNVFIEDQLGHIIYIYIYIACNEDHHVDKQVTCMTYININRKSLSSLKTMFGVGLPVKKHCQNTTSRAISGGTRLLTRVPFEGHTVSKSLNLATIEIWP